MAVLLFDDFTGTGLLTNHVGDTGMKWAETGSSYSPANGILSNGYVTTTAVGYSIGAMAAFVMPASYVVECKVIVNPQPYYSIIRLYLNDMSCAFDVQLYYNSNIYFSIFNQYNDPAYGELPYQLGLHTIRAVVDAVAQTKTLFWDGIAVAQVKGGAFPATQRFSFQLDNSTKMDAFLIDSIQITGAAPVATPPPKDRRMLVL